MIAAEQSAPRKPAFLDEPSFDVVEFGDGDEAERYGYSEFRRLPLRQRVHLLLSKPPRFYLQGKEIPRVQAMRFQG